MTRVLVKGYNLGRATGKGANLVTLRTMKRAQMAGPVRLVRKGRQVVMTQEMEDDETAPEALFQRRLYPGSLYSTWPLPGEYRGGHVPVTVPADMHTRGHRVAHLSDGMRQVSPDRFLTRRIVSNLGVRGHLRGDERPRGGEQAVAFLSFQLIAGAHTNPGQKAEAFRREQWAEGFANAKAEVADLADRGITTVYECDGNNPHMPLLHRREVRLVHNGLDYLGLIPGEAKARVVDTGVVDLRLDGHNLLWAVLDV